VGGGVLTLARFVAENGRGQHQQGGSAALRLSGRDSSAPAKRGARPGQNATQVGSRVVGRHWSRAEGAARRRQLKWHMTAQASGDADDTRGSELGLIYTRTRAIASSEGRPGEERARMAAGGSVARL
jgi:hypothetical protein